MSIFGEYSGPSGDRGYYSAADWNKLQNPEWAKDQAEYDRFAAQAEARAESRAEAMSRAREAIPFSYTQFGRGGTEPVFSLAGYSGHTSGGTAGLSGFSGTGSPVGYSSSGGGSTSGSGGGGGGPGVPDPGDRGPDVDERAEGGVILPVQHMEAGGMIASPYANPMKTQMGPIQPTMVHNETTGFSVPSRAELQGASPMGGVGGMFQNMHQQFGQQMQQMQSSPLKVYQNYLMQTYAAPEMQQQQQKVDQFLDLVDQAERAHFGAEESFGFGGGPMMQQYSQALPVPRGGPMPGSGVMGGGIASLMNG